jgi:hypothetical protein
MLRSAIPIRRAVKMPRTEKLSFLVAFNGPFVPPIKDACDEQPNDRQWQSEDDKRHSGADKHCEHEYPPPSSFCTSSRQKQPRQLRPYPHVLISTADLVVKNTLQQ